MTAAGANSSRKQRVATLAFWSIVIAFAVMGLKFVAWRMTGSVALYSDALESIVNVIAAGAAFWAIQVSHKPADPGHQFGHHKAEYFSAVLEGVLIGIAAVLILMAVARNWATPPALDQPWNGLAVNGAGGADQRGLGLCADPPRHVREIAGAGRRRPSHHDRRRHLGRRDRRPRRRGRHRLAHARPAARAAGRPQHPVARLEGGRRRRSTG